MKTKILVNESFKDLFKEAETLLESDGRKNKVLAMHQNIKFEINRGSIYSDIVNLFNHKVDIIKLKKEIAKYNLIMLKEMGKTKYDMIKKTYKI